jgi:hypothetical protein
MNPSVTLKYRDGKIHHHEKPVNGRLDVDISGCGYVTINNGFTCLFKESLGELESITILTRMGKIKMNCNKLIDPFAAGEGSNRPS